MNLTLSRANFKRIHDIACGTWKAKLVEMFPEFTTKDSVEVSQVNYDKMRAACTDHQHKLFDEIFGKVVSNWTIKSGDVVKCIKDLVMDGGQLACKKGFYYPGTGHDQITSNIGKFHHVGDSFKNEYFVLATPKETENCNVVFKAKKGDWIKWVWNDGDVDLIEFDEYIPSQNKWKCSQFFRNGKLMDECFILNQIYDERLTVSKATPEEIASVTWYPEGTICLVKAVAGMGYWRLRVASSKRNRFYNDGQLEGETSEWSIHKKYDK